jgi:hypothetical protein
MVAAIPEIMDTPRILASTLASRLSILLGWFLFHPAEAPPFVPIL